jgi:hypothetical protein
MNDNLDTAKEYNFTLKRNTTKKRLYQVLEDDKITKIDLTNHNFIMQIKKVIGSTSEVIAELSKSNGLIESGNGYFTIELITDLPARQYVYDLLVIDANNKKDYWFKGTYTIFQNVTSEV